MTLPSLTELRIRQLEAERDELTAALGQAREIAAALEEQNAAADRLHYNADGLCPTDGMPWPCATHCRLTGDVP